MRRELPSVLFVFLLSQVIRPQLKTTFCPLLECPRKNPKSKATSSTASSGGRSIFSVSQSSWLSFGSSKDGKETLREKHRPPPKYREIYRPKSFLDSAEIVLRALNNKATVASLAAGMGPESHYARLVLLKSHVPNPDDIKLQGLDEEYCRNTVEESKHCIERGKYRLAGIQHPEKWEAFLYALRTLPEYDRSVMEAAVWYKDHLVGDSDWRYNPRADKPISTSHLGDYFKADNGTFTTYDEFGREWEWTENGTGFSDVFPGERSKSGKYAWQLRAGEPTEPIITEGHICISVLMDLKKKLLNTTAPIPDEGEAMSRSGEAALEETPAGASTPKPSPPDKDDSDDESTVYMSIVSNNSEDAKSRYSFDGASESVDVSPNLYDELDNFGEGPSSSARV